MDSEKPYNRLKSLSAKAGISITEACSILGVPVGTIHNWANREPSALSRFLVLLDFFTAKIAEDAKPSDTLDEAVRRVIERHNFSNSTKQLPHNFFRVLNISDCEINPETDADPKKIAQYWASEIKRYFKGDFTLTVRDSSFAGRCFYFYGNAIT